MRTIELTESQIRDIAKQIMHTADCLANGSFEEKYDVETDIEIGNDYYAYCRIVVEQTVCDYSWGTYDTPEGTEYEYAVDEIELVECFDEDGVPFVIDDDSWAKVEKLVKSETLYY